MDALTALRPTDWADGVAIGNLDEVAIDTICNRLSYNIRRSRSGMGEAAFHQEIYAAEIRQAMGGDWSLVNRKGKLSNRLDKFLHDRYHINLDVYDHNFMASLIQNSAIPPHQYRITDQINWDRGAYGDRGSCWWNERRADRATFVASGGMALQTRTPEGKGLGRVFLLPEKNRVFMFNAYYFPLPRFENIFRLNTGWKGNSRLIKFALQGKVRHHELYLYANNGEAFVLCDQKLADKEDRELVLNGCYCTAHFNSLNMTGLAICKNCPFGIVRQPDA